MKTLTTIIVIMAGVIVFLLFFRPPPPPDTSGRKQLWDKIHLQDDSIQILNQTAELKTDTIELLRGELFEMVQVAENALSALDTLTEQEIAIESDRFIDSTLTKKETKKEIARLGTKWENCEKQKKKQSEIITRMESLTADYIKVIAKHKENGEDYKKIIARYEENEKLFKKQLKKAKWIARITVLGAVALAVYVAVH